MGYTTEQRMINAVNGTTKQRENKHSDVIGTKVDLPNFSVVSGAERVHGKVGDLKIVNDHDADLEKPQVVNVTMDTEGTPPANVPNGTIHLKYTA